MKRNAIWVSSVSLWVGVLAAAACGDDTQGTTNTTSEGDSGIGDTTSVVSSAVPSTSGSDSTTGSSPDTTSTEECVDEYPFDDGYSCEEQAGWGKCDESWLQGYCKLSCDRCNEGPIDAGPDLSGTRGVYSEYTAKQPLAPTPPMGWNSWNKFACDIDETLIRETADAMVASGMKDAGYEYINIDDCWQAEERDEDGNIVPDPVRFPNGMKAVADYVHSLGLKLGLYSDRGYETCGGFPGSYDHEIEDAQTYAEWGIDYLKYDNCAVPRGREEGAEQEEDYAIMGQALRESGRPIVFSVCAWWFYPWMPEVGHLWRTTTDIKDNWDENSHSVTRLLNWSGGTSERYGAFAEDDYQSSPYPAPGLTQYAGPNGWNDPDMLEVGNGGMTDTEYRSHFSLWALMAAPLITGNDLRDMSPATLDILTNAEVIAVNQDPLGVQGIPISDSKTLEVWSKQLSGDDTYAVVLFNRTEEEADITVTWSDLGLSSDTVAVRDLWAHEDLGPVTDEFTATVPSHGVVMIRVGNGALDTACDGGAECSVDAGPGCDGGADCAPTTDGGSPTPSGECDGGAECSVACDGGVCADASVE